MERKNYGFSRVDRKKSWKMVLPLGPLFITPKLLTQNKIKIKKSGDRRLHTGKKEVI
jgi:hypothetical protein